MRFESFVVAVEFSKLPIVPYRLITRSFVQLALPLPNSSPQCIKTTCFMICGGVLTRLECHVSGRKIFSYMPLRRRDLLAVNANFLADSLCLCRRQWGKCLFQNDINWEKNSNKSKRTCS